MPHTPLVFDGDDDPPTPRLGAVADLATDSAGRRS
jgi:hypothetical protein